MGRGQSANPGTEATPLGTESEEGAEDSHGNMPGVRSWVMEAAGTTQDVSQVLFLLRQVGRGFGGAATAPHH